MTSIYARRIADLDADKAFYRIQGITGTVSANATTNIDWAFPEERWISGGIFAVQDGTWGDKADIVIIDKDNVLGYGANTVLNTFADDFYVVSDHQQQGIIECPYIALIPAGVYIRIAYTNTNLLSATKVHLNLFTHIPRA